MKQDIASQLLELQTQFAFQEDLLSALNDRVVEQDREIDQLKRMLGALHDNYRKLADNVAEHDGAVERPPHY